jgi:hypothetical protein
MYFLGIERREPAREREEMKRRVAKLKGEFTRNTGLRFRIQTLHARFLSYERMWLRSAREKEEGTYRRDLLRARRHAARQEEKRRRDEEASARAKGTAPVAPGPAAPSAPAVTPAAAPPPAPAPAATPRPAEIPEAQLRALFAAYVDAKRRCIAKQVPELLAKHKATRVEFRVVVKDGRAVLKAVPRV